MRRLLILTGKDLRRRLARPAGFLLSLSIPLVLAGTMALTFGNRGGEPATPTLRIVLVDLDESPLSGIIAGASQNPRATERMEVRRASTVEEGLRLLREEEYSALLVIPDGFGEGLLGDRRVELELIKNPAQNIMPVVAQHGAEVVALYLSAGARLLAGEGPRIRDLLEEGQGWGDAAGLAATIATLYGRVNAAGNLLFPPIVEVRVEDEKAGEGAGGFDLMGWMFPGMIVMGLLFTALNQMSDLLHERSSGTLRRQLASPLGAGLILLSKVAGVALVVAAAMAIYLVIGTLAFGIRWGSPLPAAAVGAAIVFCVTGFAALIFSVVRTVRQGDAFGGILTMLMSLLGGAFVPSQVMPDWLRGVSKVTVSHWGNEALRSLTAGGGWAEAAPFLATLAAMGLVFTGLGTLLLRLRHVKGTL